MDELKVQAGSIEMVYQTFGEPEQPAIVLIMGLGMQMIAWPDAFCQSLADQGFYVIRFDNRDAGLSQRFEGLRSPGPIKLMVSQRLSLPISVPYHLNDMAADTVALLDALDIEQAHIVGASMGGMIAQLIAAHHKERVRSLTSIMSTSGNPRLPRPKPRVMMRLARPPAKNENDYLKGAIETISIIGSPDFRPDPEELRERLSRSYRRGYYPQGARRQMAAIAAGGSRVAALQTIEVPSLVIHGKADPLVPVAGGVDTAKHIPDARLELIDGMGHDLPSQLLPHIAEMIGSHAQTHS